MTQMPLVRKRPAERTLTQARRQRHRPDTPQRLSRDQIAYIVTSLTGITEILAEADPLDKAEIYNKPGLRLTYHPRKAAVLVEARPAPEFVCRNVVSEAGHALYANSLQKSIQFYVYSDAMSSWRRWSSRPKR